MGRSRRRPEIAKKSPCPELRKRTWTRISRNSKIFPSCFQPARGEFSPRVFYFSHGCESGSRPLPRCRPEPENREKYLLKGIRCLRSISCNGAHNFKIVVAQPPQVGHIFGRNSPSCTFKLFSPAVRVNSVGLFFGGSQAGRGSGCLFGANHRPSENLASAEIWHCIGSPLRYTGECQQTLIRPTPATRVNSVGSFSSDKPI